MSEQPTVLPQPASRPERLDAALMRRGIANSRSQAQRLILAGKVRIGGQRIDKTAFRVGPETAIELEPSPPYVSRAGEKLAGAFKAFGLNVSGKTCLDVGASTGGFTDCLLQQGAARVIALDVGRGQLHWRLRRDPRVTVIEGFNARYLSPADLPVTPSFAVIDVSFISLRLILPPVCGAICPGAGLIALIKPQFEAGRNAVGKGGVVRDMAVREAVIEDIRAFGTTRTRLVWQACTPSPLSGPKGNIEFLSWWRKKED